MQLVAFGAQYVDVGLLNRNENYLKNKQYKRNKEFYKKINQNKNKNINKKYTQSIVEQQYNILCEI